MIYSKKKPTLEEIDKGTRFVQTIFTQFTSPEVISWMRATRKKCLTDDEFKKAVEELATTVNQRMLESKIQFKDDIEQFEYAMRLQRKIISENLEAF